MTCVSSFAFTDLSAFTFSSTLQTPLLIVVAPNEDKDLAARGRTVVSYLNCYLINFYFGICGAKMKCQS